MWRGCLAKLDPEERPEQTDRHHVQGEDEVHRGQPVPDGGKHLTMMESSDKVSCINLSYLLGPHKAGNVQCRAVIHCQICLVIRTGKGFHLLGCWISLSRIAKILSAF